MSGSSGSNTQGRGFYLLLLFAFALGLFVFGLLGRDLFQVLLGVGVFVVAIVIVVVRMTDSPVNDAQRRAEAESSQMKNMDPPPRGSSKWSSVKYHLTHGEPVPGPSDMHVSHDDYHHLATNERYLGSAFTEDGPHMLDIRRRERGEDQDS